MSTEPAPYTPRWTPEPLEETLDGARRLSVSVADRITRAGWESLSRAAGIPARRWRRWHPLPDGAPLVALVDGRAAFDARAWERFVSLVPGAMALPARTAEAFGVERAAVRPPGRPPGRLLDLARHRRVRASLRRALRTLDADHALHRAAVEREVAAALAPGEDGSALAGLPTYALAARLEALLDAPTRWEFPATVDLASALATRDLLRVLRVRELDELAAYDQLARLQAGGGVPRHAHLEQLAAVDANLEASDLHATRDLAAWADGAGGWHAARDLVLECPPLRDDLDAARRAARTTTARTDGLQTPPAPHGLHTTPAERGPRATHPLASTSADTATDDPELADAAAHARRLVAVRELVARDRAWHVAGVRALTWSIAHALHVRGDLEDVDDAFDLGVTDLVRLARGGTPLASPDRASRRPTAENLASNQTEDSTPTTSPTAAALADVTVRGVGASAGTATGRVVVLRDPSLDADVDGAVLVCRTTDPAWLPLMLRCAALVTERGGPLAHAAIVARELGLPAVVGAAGALEAAERASSADVDGATGLVAFRSLA